MANYIGDWIRITGYYASSGKTNDFIPFSGYGIIKDFLHQHHQGWLIVDIGVNTVIVNPRDIEENYGNKPSGMYRKGDIIDNDE